MTALRYYAPAYTHLIFWHFLSNTFISSQRDIIADAKKGRRRCAGEPPRAAYFWPTIPCRRRHIASLAPIFIYTWFTTTCSNVRATIFEDIFIFQKRELYMLQQLTPLELQLARHSFGLVGSAEGDASPQQPLDSSVLYLLPGHGTASWRCMQ